MHQSDDTRSTQHRKQGSRVDAYGLFHLLVARLKDSVMQRLNSRPQADHDEYSKSKQERK